MKLDPKYIARRFSTAQTGSLTCYYQLFWPVHKFDDYLKQLDIASAEIFSDRGGKDRHRPKVLPLVARVHALPDVSDKQGHSYSEDIIGAHREFTDPSGGSEYRRRNAAMIIWKNATAALTRNIENWRSFESASLSNEAARLCEFYLCEDYTELLEAAVSAFQFLLTYEKALNDRGDTTYAPALAARIQHILDGAGKRPTDWFVELHRLYSPLRGWDQMPPEINEVLVGHRAFSPELANYVILLRLAYNVGNHAIAVGERQSPYVAAKDVSDSRTPFIFGNYGISQERVLAALRSSRMQDDPRLGMPWTAVKAGGIELALQISDETHRETQEQLRAEQIQSLVPFRQFDEQLRTEKLTNALGTDEPLRACVTAIVAGASRKASMHKIWQLTAEHQAKELCQLLAIDSGSVHVNVEEEIEKNNLSKVLDDTFDCLSSEVRQRTRTTVAMPGTSIGGAGASVSPTEGELPMPNNSTPLMTEDGMNVNAVMQMLKAAESSLQAAKLSQKEIDQFCKQMQKADDRVRIPAIADRDSD